MTQVARVAPTSMPVLITGETGTGKEVMARLIHAWSPRRARFVPINCAAIPERADGGRAVRLRAWRVLGRGAAYDGQLMAAAGGTVFLDEIDDTPLPTQVKLLRVLEDRVVSRLGENEWHEVDFRILAATNRDLRALIERASSAPTSTSGWPSCPSISLPLRERREDIPRWPRTSWRASHASRRAPPVARSHAERWRRCAATPGPATSASCAT